MPISFFKHIASSQANGLSRFLPPETLRNIVEGFYVYNNARITHRQLFFNDGFPVLVFMGARDNNVRLDFNGRTESLSRIWICYGMLRNTYYSQDTDIEEMIVVRLQPTAYNILSALCPDIFKEYGARGFSRLNGPELDILEERHYATDDLPTRLLLISNFLQHFSTSVTPPALLNDILSYVEETGPPNIKYIQQNYATRLNYKWLERNFKKHVGMSPKNFLLVRRFLKTFIDMNGSLSEDLLQLALENGYYDDNHLIKDFKRFSGLAPRQYFAGRPHYKGSQSSMALPSGSSI